MRTRLKSIEKIQEFEIDLDNQVATITFDKDLDIESTLNELADVNDKMKEWSFEDD